MSYIKRIFFDASENIGIGTSRPQSKLDISGNVSISGHLLPGSNITFDLGSPNKRWKDLYLSGNTIDLSGTRLSRHTDGSLMVHDSSDNMLNGRFKDVIAEGNVTCNNLTVNGTTTTIDSSTATFENAASGNPGHIVIRNSYYNNQIQIRSKYNEDDNHIFTWNGSSVDKLIINGAINILGNGNVGLGQTNPQAKLDVNGNILSPTFVGMVCHFATSSAPNGWLKCNGAAISRTSYANLYATIGTTFGTGDGSTTFNLPDLRGEFIRSWSDGRSVDSGRGFGTFQYGSIAWHIGYIAGAPTSALGTGYSDGWTSFGSAFDDGVQNGVASNTNVYGTTTPNYAAGYIPTNSSTTANTINWNIWKGTRPRNIALLACIKY